MRKLGIGIVIVVAISMLFVQTAFAQRSQAGGAGVSTGAWSLGVPESGIDQDAIETGAFVDESGKVVKMEKMPGMKDGLQMQFKTDQGIAYTVYLGPDWFINNQKIKFMAGDSVVVRGKKIGFSIIATEISKGDWTLKLRNEDDGRPQW